MASDGTTSQYFVYETRLASFRGPQPVSKRRASNASSRAPKAMTWPHKSITPEALAAAGFYFNPVPNNPDNVACFLCHKSLDGWEEDDNPLSEHLTHSPECGWAIVAAIEAEYGDYDKMDPREPLMVEARKATFAGRWPYESSRGWKCKTKQLVEAGWKYTPTIDADDNATCAYCDLSLDGWEPSDKPMDEHHRRAPDCPYFTLVAQNPPPKKTRRGKTARASQASRMSLQSVGTVMSEMPSMLDATMDHDESTLTTTSVMTQGTKKGKSRKATASSKSRKTRAKKDEAVEISDDVHPDELNAELTSSPAKSNKGRKRMSDEVEDAVVTNAEAPAPKRRATRARTSTAVEDSVLTTATQDVEMEDDAPSKPATTRKATSKKKTRASAAKSTRKVSAASVASVASPTGKIPDDDEIDRQLQADLERPLTDDEDLVADSESERTKKPPASTKTKAKKVTTTKRKGTLQSQQQQPQPPDEGHYAMFDPVPAEPDEAAVEAELKALQAEMEVVQPEPEEIKIPKKGRKATGTRKPSKQVKKGKQAPQPESEPEPESEPRVDPEQDAQPKPQRELVQPEPPVHVVQERQDLVTPAEQYDASIASTETVVNRPEEQQQQAKPAKRGRGRPKKSDSSQISIAESVELVQVEAEAAPASVPAPQPVKRGRGRPRKTDESQTAADGAARTSKADELAGLAPVPTTAPAVAPVKVQVEVEPATIQETFSPAPEKKSRTAPAPALTQTEKPLPTIPLQTASLAGNRAVVVAHRHIISTPSAKQATISPSQSPQSSDAENRPPSARPTFHAAEKPVGLAPALAIATPIRQYNNGGSPSKRDGTAGPAAHVIGGLQSTTPWKAVDMELVFAATDDRENAAGLLLGGSSAGEQFVLRQGGELTSPEKGMTVEEWIYHNAGQAEQKLKYECEVMVGAFEREGSRAMRVLERLVVD